MAEVKHNHDTQATPEQKMRALLEVVSSYIEHYHGGWVRLVEFDGKTLKVKMGGACEGCALAAGTLHGWVEGTVRQFFPDIERIEEI
jgi:Fe-S cluster biogenesis protein NfuA